MKIAKNHGDILNAILKFCQKERRSYNQRDNFNNREDVVRVTAPKEITDNDTYIRSELKVQELAENNEWKRYVEDKRCRDMRQFKAIKRQRENKEVQ